MKFPWTKKFKNDQLIISLHNKTLAYILAHVQSDGKYFISSFGVEKDDTTPNEFISKLTKLGLKGINATAMLKTEQYQLLQIDSPVASSEELLAAARYKVKGMLEAHIDDYIIDLMKVGDGNGRVSTQLFVAASLKNNLQEILKLSDSMHWGIKIIDVQENSQRNIQNNIEPYDKTGNKYANVAISINKNSQTILTIVASGELYYSRRFDLSDDFFTSLDSMWKKSINYHKIINESEQSDELIDEYVPSEYQDYHDTIEENRADDSVPVDTRKLSADRLVLEIQRSIEGWERSHPDIQIKNVRILSKTEDIQLVHWLQSLLFQSVSSLNLEEIFSNINNESFNNLENCIPLTGILLRKNHIAL